MNLTEGHLAGAKKFVDSMDSFGDQPFCVVYNNGEIVVENKTAFCASGAFIIDYEMERQPVLFQTFINEAREGDRRLTAPTKENIKYLTAIVKKSIVSRYIVPHSPDIWLTHGIPIRLFDVPQSAPLITSTHVRAMWDRHNRYQVESYLKWIEQFPRMSVKKVFLLSNILQGVSFEPDTQSTFSGYDGVHSPFGSGISVIQAQNYLLDKDIFKGFKEPVFTGNKRGGVCSTFSKRTDKGVVRDLIGKIVKTLPSYEEAHRMRIWLGKDTKTLGKLVLEEILNA